MRERGRGERKEEGGKREREMGDIQEGQQAQWVLEREFGFI